MVDRFDEEAGEILFELLDEACESNWGYGQDLDGPYVEFDGMPVDEALDACREAGLIPEFKGNTSS